MRSRTILLVVLSALFLLIFASAAQADEDKEITIIVDGQKIQPDVPAYISHARTMVPLRFIAEAFGFKVNWAGEDAVDPVQIYPVIPGVNNQLQGVADDFGYFGLRPGDVTMRFMARKLADDSTVTTGNFFKWSAAVGDVAAEIRDGRTFIPLRMVAEAFGCRVDWDPDTWTVTVGKYDPEKVMLYHPALRIHYRQDIYPGRIYCHRDYGSDNVKISAVILAQSGGLESSMPIVDNVPVVFYLDGREVSRAVQELVFDRDYAGSFGATASVVVPWPKGESHTVKVVVDPDKKHWDCNRGNNVMEKSFTVE
ncbi:MAG: copper amine oxidase N-terminal domain-containing protein [Peptococcaceae bacterium]|nr:copper amine oxidase N-terminal domain-containing protein [Peptococcaceae bacterium]